MLLAVAAAAGAAAAFIVIRQRSMGTDRDGRPVGALIGITLGTALWWATGAFVLWIDFLALGGLIGFGINRHLHRASGS